MSGKKGSEGKRKMNLPKVEVNPVYSDEEGETSDKPVDEETRTKKMSDVSSDSGAFSQGNTPAKQKKQDLKKNPKDFKSTGNPNAEVGECSHHLSPEGSPSSKGKRSRSPIKKLTAGAEALLKAVKDVVMNLSPTKKDQLTDSMEVEHERPEPQSYDGQKPKKTKEKRITKKLSEMYEAVSSDSENVDSAVTNISNVPDSDQTSVDEKSDILDPFEDSEVKDAKDDSVDDAKKGSEK